MDRSETYTLTQHSSSQFIATVRGIRAVSPEEEKEGCNGKDLNRKKVLSLE